MICAQGLGIVDSDSDSLHCECLAANYEANKQFSQPTPRRRRVSQQTRPDVSSRRRRPRTRTPRGPFRTWFRCGLASHAVRGRVKQPAPNRPAAGLALVASQPASAFLSIFPAAGHTFLSILFFVFFLFFFLAIFHATCANFLRDGAKMRPEWAQAPCLCYGNQKFAIYKLLSQCQPSSLAASHF